MLLRHKFLILADSCTGIHHILRIALLVRLAVWMAMCLSCQVLPDHDPGNDVLRFDLSLNNNNNNNKKEDDLFYFDDCSYSFQSLLHPDFLMSSNHQDKTECATTTSPQKLMGPVLRILQKRIYPFLLMPLTRWDAARFLRLAHDPGLRYRTSCLPLVLNENDDEKNDDTTCPNPYWEAEQAHAFLPLFPWTIRITATIFWHIIPRSWLPASCQALLVLAGALFNMACFLGTTWDLYYMTLRILLYHHHHQSGQQKKNDDNDNDNHDMLPSTLNVCNHLAQRTALVFVFNPANVFFGTVYSESLAAFLLFKGCRFAVNMLTTSWSHCNNDGKSNSNFSVLRQCFAMMPCSFFWFLAAWTRSNANLYAGFLLLYGMGMCIRQDSKYWERLFCLSWSVLLAVGFVLGSMGFYNKRTVHWLCHSASMIDKTGLNRPWPVWCEQSRPWFNLYGHIQVKYWNVGFLRYYQWKQMPNFLLAAPILILSMAAVIRWIQASWFYFEQRCSDCDAAARLSIIYNIRRLIQWAIQSLRTFAKEGGITMQPTFIPEDILVGSPLLLGFYAVLGVSVLLGLFVAHVQISTRLLCSSCPALYWFCTVLIHSNPRRLGDATLFYFALYIFLGCILHPNWLPWT